MDILKANINKADMGALITMWLMLEFFETLNCQVEWGSPFPLVRNQEDFYYLLLEWQKFLLKKPELITMFENTD